MLALLRRNAQLRALAIGFACTQLGMQIGWIALVWWVLNTAHSPKMLGLLFVAFQLPALLSAPLLGTLADRFNAKTTAVWALGVETLASVALAALAIRGTLTLPVLLGLVVIFALGTPATVTFRRKLIGQITDAGDLTLAYAALSLGNEASVLLGPPLAVFSSDAGRSASRCAALRQACSSIWQRSRGQRMRIAPAPPNKNWTCWRAREKSRRGRSSWP